MTESTRHKFQFQQGINKCEIVQCRSASPSSQADDLDEVLQFVGRYNEGRDRRDVFVVLTDPKDNYSRVDAVLQKNGVSGIVCLGSKADQFSQRFTSAKKHVYERSDEFLNHYLYEILYNALVILLNADDDVIAQVGRRLQLHSDRATLHVDLDIIKENIAFYRAKITAETKICAVIKSASYGAGYNLCQLLEGEVDSFAVACTVEGIWLRQCGVSKPILIFNPRVESYDKIIHYNLEPTVFTMKALSSLNAMAKSQDKTVDVHLELESGFNRHGFANDHLDELVSTLLQPDSCIRVKAIFSHLSSNVEYQKAQGEQFVKMFTKIETALGIKAIKHLLSTSELDSLPQYYFDMVRLGEGMYGFTCEEHLLKHLRYAMSMTASVSQVIPVGKGARVSYERNNAIYTAPHAIDVATLDLGYVDIYRQQYGPKSAGVVYKGSQTIPNIGRICMDMGMYDVTGRGVNEGDEVTLFGGEDGAQGLDEFSGEMWRMEVLAKIHQRVQRIFYANSLKKHTDCNGIV